MSDSKQLTSAPSNDISLTDIWKFSADVSDRLLAWNVFNVIIGLILGRGRGFLRGFASQNIGWGMINGAIALLGQRLNRRRMDALDDPSDLSVQAAESRNLRLILAFNGLLDILYMLGGRRLARSTRLFSMRRGIGVGVLVQGALLFFFDWQMLRRSFRIKSS
jgi:hypothetical protein